MPFLTATTETLELTTSSTSSLAVISSYVDNTSSSQTPNSQVAVITTATTTVIVSAPPASTQRVIIDIYIRNQGTTPNTITFQKDVSATNYPIAPAITLNAGESCQMDKQGKILIYDVNGRVKTNDIQAVGYSGRTLQYLKIGVACEAIGVRHSLHASTGIPSAWAVGTSGLAGRATDGTTTTDAGCIPYQNPATGTMYLCSFDSSVSVINMMILADYLWVNNAIVVTTTTAQTINSVAFPARDVNGSTNGEGVNIAILVTTATTNAGAIANTTMSYTNSDGTAGRTATISSFPATAVAGTIVAFQLQAGDRGVRSIQTVTLGTSYGGGAISLIAYRDLARVPNPVVNVGQKWNDLTGIKLYNGTCMLLSYIPSATTATNCQGTVTMIER